VAVGTPGASIVAETEALSELVPLLSSLSLNLKAMAEEAKAFDLVGTLGDIVSALLPEAQVGAKLAASAPGFFAELSETLFGPQPENPTGPNGPP
jgi:hypothetical protein